MSDKQKFDIFINQKKYPDASSIFNLTLKSTNAIKDDAIFVLDTNSLLVPYTTSSESLEEIERIYIKLIAEKRLIIPAQVAREFANNRPRKISEIFQQIKRRRDSISISKMGNYPLLSNLSEYKQVLEVQEKIEHLIKEQRKLLSSITISIKDWAWNDPISKIYRKLFIPEIIKEINFEEKKIEEELDFRFTHKIPPGFKDQNKLDKGIGDLLIWKTILDIASENKNVIFVSSDAKTDWFHRVENQTLFPRFELLHEFKRASGNKNFHIIKLSELLDLFGANNKSIKEVNSQEQRNLINASPSKNKTKKAQEIEWHIMDLLFERYEDEVGISFCQEDFPDIEVEHDDGYKIGVIINLLPHKLQNIFEIVKEKIFKAFNEYGAGNYDKYIFYFVVPQNKWTLDMYPHQVISSIKEANVQSIEMEILIGTYSDEEGFKKIQDDT